MLYRHSLPFSLPLTHTYTCSVLTLKQDIALTKAPCAVCKVHWVWSHVQEENLISPRSIIQKYWLITFHKRKVHYRNMMPAHLCSVMNGGVYLLDHWRLCCSKPTVSKVITQTWSFKTLCALFTSVTTMSCKNQCLKLQTKKGVTLFFANGGDI